MFLPELLQKENILFYLVLQWGITARKKKFTNQINMKIMIPFLIRLINLRDQVFISLSFSQHRGLNLLST